VQVVGVELRSDPVHHFGDVVDDCHVFLLWDSIKKTAPLRGALWHGAFFNSSAPRGCGFMPLWWGIAICAASVGAASGLRSGCDKGGSAECAGLPRRFRLLLLYQAITKTRQFI
jgi:hypothetical protein